jgi:hypothetical protein
MVRRPIGPRAGDRRPSLRDRPSIKGKFPVDAAISAESRIAGTNDRETGKSLKCATILIVSGDIPLSFEATKLAPFGVS